MSQIFTDNFQLWLLIYDGKEWSGSTAVNKHYMTVMGLNKVTRSLLFSNRPIFSPYHIVINILHNVIKQQITHKCFWNHNYSIGISTYDRTALYGAFLAVYLIHEVGVMCQTTAEMTINMIKRKITAIQFWKL